MQPPLNAKRILSGGSDDVKAFAGGLQGREVAVEADDTPAAAGP
jgi:hypothetical protein